MNHVTIIGTVTAKPETRVEVQKLLSAQVGPTRQETGCINYDFHVDATDPCVFVFYENWRSQQDLDAHMDMPHLTALFSQVDRLLASPVNIRYLKMQSEIV
jgi:quinol monooxygenase YgiN